jgi:hypothetical protein
MIGQLQQHKKKLSEVKEKGKADLKKQKSRGASKQKEKATTSTGDNGGSVTLTNMEDIVKFHYYVRWKGREQLTYSSLKQEIGFVQSTAEVKQKKSLTDSQKFYQHIQQVASRVCSSVYCHYSLTNSFQLVQLSIVTTVAFLHEEILRVQKVF